MTLSSQQALRALRIAVCVLIFVHGSFRLVTGGVIPFGEFLTESHIPLGPVVAGGITAIEMIGTIVLALGYFVRPLAIYYAAELTMGIILVHVKEGWFVVGGGRNGMEYSVLLICVFLAVASSPPERRKAVSSEQ
ncbi:MAG TPA: DoxX family protein [Gemmatimonadales bacterium]|nr:DoxX family protein [Gemmatimonadales bacterium]